MSGIDGVVFVADSQEEKLDDNYKSLRELEMNLNSHDMTLNKLPFVVQYNRRDLPNILEIEELDTVLLTNNNIMRAPSFEAVAIDGRGVIETFIKICNIVLAMLEKRYGLKKQFR